MLPVLLCIDDSPYLLRIRKTALEPYGFSVVSANSASRAITMLEKSPVTAVLLEYKPEGMDAEAIAFHIKNRFPQQTVILLSAYSEIPERILWLVDEYVSKSAPPEQLAGIISRMQSSAEKRTQHVPMPMPMKHSRA